MSKPYKHFHFYYAAVMTVSFAQFLFVRLSWWLAPSRHLPELHVIGCVSACVSPVMDGTPLTLHSWDRLQFYVYIY